MRIFKILGIEPTKNEMEIKEAYLNKLSDTNPEDKPEEFMQLRKAYEEAIEYANQEDEEDKNEIDNTEIGLWMAKVREVYNNFRARNDINAWSELLKDDVCQNIETKTDARDALLEFFMQNYYLPSAVIRFLNEFFNFEEDIDELYESFPAEFIDNIIVDGIKYDEYPSYSLFEIKDGLDYEAFLTDFYEMNRKYRERDIEKTYDLLQDLKEYGIYHPEVDKKEAVVLYNLDRLDEALDIISNIDPKYNEVVEADLLKGMILADKGQNEEAKQYYKTVLKREPSNVMACEGLCIIYKNEGRFAEARELLTVINSEGYEYEEIDRLFDELNQDIINDYENKVRLGQDKFETDKLLEIAHTYYIVDRLDEAYNIANSIEVDENTDLMIYRLFARIYLDMKKYDEALKYADMWKNGIENASEEKLSNFAPKYKSMENVYFTKAWIYNQKGENNNALKELNKSLEILPNDVQFLNMKNKILFANQQYEEVLKVCDKIIEINPEVSEAYMMKIRSLYELEYLKEAFDECNDILYKDPYNLFAYIYKIRILIEVEEIEIAKEEIKSLRNEDVENQNLDFLEALILDYEDKREEATEIYKNLIKKLEEEDDGILAFPEELYFYYINEIFNTDEEGDVLELAQKGLKYSPKHQGLLYYKGIELSIREQYNDAKETFEYIAQLYPDNGYSDRKIGDIYNDQELYEKALEYYNKQIEKEYDIDDYFKRVQVNLELLNLDDLYKDLVYLDKNLKDDPRLYEYFGIYYNMIDNAKKSYEYFIKAKEIFDNSDEYESSSYLEGTLGLVCAKLGMSEDAIKYYRENYENTNDPSDLIDIYNQYVKVGDFDKGEEILDEYLSAMNKSKLSAEAMSRMANLNIEKRNMKAALKTFSLMVKPEPDHKRDRAKLLFYTGNYKKALKLIEEAIKELQFVADNRANYITAGRICLELGDKVKAHSYAKKVIELTPVDNLKSKVDRLPYIYQYLGDSYIILGEYDKAYEYIDKALTSPRCFFCSEVKCIDAMCSLAYLEYVKGNIDKVKAHLDEIFKLDISRTDAIGLAYKIGLFK